ncbi:MAG: hypothetical protein KKA62_06005, partial [Nanoarchaeota archaeon]|nr:hypothetical protein [Nanoarchaeota archaeon]
IQVEAEISGYEYSDYESLQDTTQLFDLSAGTLKFVNLKVTLPTKLEKDTYWLRLRVMDKNTDAIVEKIELAVEPARHGLDIADVAFSPGNTVKAGKSLMATVLLENFGDKVEKDVKVTVEIPALGVSATEYVDVVPDDKDWDQDPNVAYEDVEEMVLMIPNTAKAGEYEVKVSARYDNMYETVTKTYTLNVLADKEFAAQDNNLILAVGPEGQNVAAGKTATYAVALTNAGSTSKAFAVGAAAGNWATSVSLSESLVVLEPGKNAVVYMEVAVAEDAAAGEHLVSLVVNSGNEDLKTVVLKANVVESKPAPVTGTSVSLRNGLEIALVVLVVLLVVIGLIVGFSRLRKDEEEEEQTYY